MNSGIKLKGSLFVSHHNSPRREKCKSFVSSERKIEQSPSQQHSPRLCAKLRRGQEFDLDSQDGLNAYKDALQSEMKRAKRKKIVKSKSVVKKMLLEVADEFDYKFVNYKPGKRPLSPGVN
jgi:hypothetical protein